MSGKKRRETVFYAVHGFAQFLKQLEGALVLSVLWNRDLKVMTDHLKTLGYLEFDKLLTYSPPRLAGSNKRKLETAAPLRVGEIRREDYELLRGFPTTARPPLMRAFALENLVRGPLCTRGYVLPPGSRFHIVTSVFQLSDYLSQRVNKIVNPILPRIEGGVGIHLRNTDRATNLQAMKAKLETRLAKRGSPSVFLASDDEDVAEHFKRDFPKTEFLQLKRPFSMDPSARNLHFGVNDESAEAQLYYAVADIYLLSRCQDFIPAHQSKTQWRHLIRAMRTPWGKNFMLKVTQQPAGASGSHNSGKRR